jgi:NtrC-family two-component system response regulator AlgB
MSEAKPISGAPARVLLVDDEAAIVRTFRYCLEDSGYRVTTAQNSAQALAALEREVFDVAFLDVGLGEENGIELLPKLKAAAPWMRVVMATAQTSVDIAVAAMRAGASDYLLKPCSSEHLRFCAQKQVEARRLEARVEALERERGSGAPTDVNSATPGMAQVLDEARRVADTDASVLILGESGTGKGVLARAIHSWSPRARGHLVTVNCPSLSSELLESELFGHAKGSFTGASESTQGRVAQADGGTLFLDEIGDFPLALQPKLLRFVQDKEYERVGDPATRRADVRIVAATNRDLDQMVADGTFRQDLLYRLNVITLKLPGLRDRPDDLVGLAERSLMDFAANYRRPARGFTDAAQAAIRSYAWPGNIRELRNVIERAVILCAEPKVDVGHLSIANGAAAAPGTARVGADVTLADLERAHILAVMANAATLDAAAKTLGIDSSTLYRKRKQYGL